MEVKAGYKQTEVGVIPKEWDCAPIASVARLESGHTPSKRKPSYWGGTTQWVSLHDTDALDGREIQETAKTITDEGLNNSSARLLPAGTVVFSRTATVGKSTVMATSMATSQDFANYICGPRLHNHFLVYLFRSMGRTWRSLMAGSIHNTIYMPIFKALQIALPPLPEQHAIATALYDMDVLLGGLNRLIAKKRDLKQAAMQQLLTGKTRLPGFHDEWEGTRLGTLGSTYGGLTGKTKSDFGDGSSQYVTFLNVMKNVVVDCNTFEQVRVAPTESQNRVTRGDLLFNGSSETPEEVAMCALLQEDIGELYLNSFCFGFRLRDDPKADGLFLAYYIRSCEGRELMKSLAQGSTRFNISKGALLNATIRLPSLREQTAIAAMLSDMDAELAALESQRDKTRALKQAMMQDLLTGKTRLVAPSSSVVAVDFAAGSKSAQARQPATKSHNWQINEAVVVAVLVKQFGSEQYPLGRKRCTKLAYLMHRHVEHVALGYLKKAAGPYNPAVKYKGPEGIAQKNGYIRPHSNGKFSGFVIAEKISQAESYFDDWYGRDVLAWLEQFRRHSNDELELLATVDMAVEDLKRVNLRAGVEAVKSVIRNHPEWEAKLEREIFSDINIARAIRRVSELFPTGDAP